MVITEEHDSNVTASFELHVISQGVGNLHNFVSVSKDIWPWVDYIHIREKQQPPKQRRSGQTNCINQAFRLIGL
ncbi:hypothetical protein [Paenibacillus sp. DCT19]|uniref:hypothetical protein n=1 Tax=Paenibacillus sp. DCT19 TaxID=2211212 RepID=UPI000FE23D52|nr:hypothetical protein [Paenibacillus sp. DCT19]